jgi:uncharacterized protein (TIGR00297 family)
MSLARGEIARKVVHIGCVGFAFLLRYMNGGQAAAMAVAAVVFNWQILPRIGGKAIWRGADHAKGYPIGILLYPLSVLGLTLWFWSALWMAAAIWGVLAVGDGMASLVGQAAGGPRLPWNDKKSWAGFVAFVGFGTPAAAVLIAWTARLPLDLASWHAGRTVGLAFAVSLACALVESLPTTLDDNLTVPLAGAVVFPLFAQADPQMLATDPGLGGRVAAGLLVSGVIALVAWRARSIDLAGALSAVLIGTAITAGLGLPSLGLMIAFFVVGTAATRLGHRIKIARGIAQEGGGARGWRHAWANGGVPAFLALLGGLTAVPRRDRLVLACSGGWAPPAADTCSSEVGKAYGRRTFLITSLRPVPPGTEGAISLEGTLGGLLGAAIVAAAGAALGVYSWPLAALVALAGLLGSLAESVIGTVAERRGWLDNNLLNALNTAIGAGLAVTLVDITR